MFCPQCRSEFREGYTQCVDCQINLVAKLDSEADDIIDVNVVPVLRTNNQGLLATAQAAIKDAGIPCYVRGGEAASLMPVNATLVVPEEHAEAARTMIREAEAAHDTAE